MTPLLATLSGTNNIATVTTVSTVSAVTAISNALPAGNNNIGDVDVASIASFPDNEPFNVAQWGGTAVVAGGTNGTVAIGGIQAADAAISGNNPVLVAGFGSSTLPTAMSASGDVTRPWLTLNGVLNITGRTVTGDSTTDDTLDAVKVTNSTASTATSYLTARLSDGTNFLTTGTDYTHDAALTIGSSAGPLTVGRASAAAPTNVSADDDAVAAWFLRNGSQVVNLAAGGTLITATSSSLNVACTTGCSGGTQYAEDAAFTTGDSTTLAGVVRADTKGTGIGANGDVAVLQVNSSGELYVTNTGNVAHDAAGTSVNPVLVGGYASQAAPSDVSADGDATRLWTLRNGSIVSNLAAGGTLITATSSSLNVNLTNTSVSVNPGTAANFGIYVEDAGETAGGNLMMAGAVRRDTAASSAGTTGDNASFNTDASGLLWVRHLDPCAGASGKTAFVVNISSAATTEITPSLAGASNHYYVCSINLVTASANNVALVDDDSDGCGSVSSGLAGGTSAASGWNFGANGGLTLGNGQGTIAQTAGTNRVLCLVTSASTQLSGTIIAVAAP
jgi:hypothetical protein